MQQKIEEAVGQGLSAVENDDIAGAKENLAEATRLGGESHVGVLHLQGAIAWHEGEFDRAAGFFLQAVDAEPSDPVIYLDCAELLISDAPDFDEAENIVQRLLERTDLEQDARDHAFYLLARIRLDQDEPDPEQAVAILDEVAEESRSNPYYAHARAEALMELGRTDEAIDALLCAIEESPDDPDLLYSLGTAYRIANREEDSTDIMCRVLELDCDEDDPEDELDITEVQELRTQLEDVFEDLPEPLLRRVSNAAITVALRPSREHVLAGVDPRSVLAFEPKEGSTDADPELDKIVIFRNVIDMTEEDLDEEYLVEMLISGLLVEMQRFFKIDDIITASV